MSKVEFRLPPRGNNPDTFMVATECENPLAFIVDLKAIVSVLFLADRGPAVFMDNPKLLNFIPSFAVLADASCSFDSDSKPMCGWENKNSASSAAIWSVKEYGQGSPKKRSSGT